MNNKQKQKRALLAVLLTVLLVVIIVLASAISCCAQKDPGNVINAGVIVSEVLASNKQAVRDPMGTYSDYIELRNVSNESVNLSGYGLSDDETSMWIIADNTVLGPGEYLVIWCAGQSTGIKNVADFALSKDDVLRFSDPSGRTIMTLDLKNTFSGLSYSYVDSGEWVNMAPTPGFPNNEAGVAAYEQSRMADQQVDVSENTECPVRITELMAANGNVHKGPDGTYCDWIELYNSGSTEFDLSGFGLSDNISKPKKYTFPNGTKIGAYSYLVLYHTEVPVDGYLCLDFGLSGQGETLVFTSADDRIVDLIEFGVQQKNCSYAKIYTNGMFEASSPFAPSDKPTPGFDNTASGYEQFDKKENGQMGVHDISLNEILVDGYYITLQDTAGRTDRPYDNDLGSWIELYNRSDATVDLSGYSITDNERKPRKWVFPDGTSIAGKGYLVLQLKGSLPREGQSEKNVTEEQRKFLLNFDIQQAGETVYLFDATGLLIDRVTVPEARACVSYGRDASGDWKLFSKPTEGAANDTNGLGLYCEAAVADTPSGIYQGTQTVNIHVPDGCIATYTLSCGKENDPVKTTTPTLQSDRVTGPIAIKENTVLRVRTFASDNSRYPSDVKSYTYVIVGNEMTIEAHTTNLPVVFLVTDPQNLWDTDIGIYIKGDDYTGPGSSDEIIIGEKETMGKYANFNMRGRMWERPTTFTYTSAGGQNVLYETDLNIRIFGAFSRKKGQKGIALLARKGIGGESPMQYAFFSNRPFTEYKSLVLRASGQDSALSRIRDILVQSLLDDADVDIANQAFIQCVVYINGQYWGVYNLREKISKWYIAQHYGINDVSTIDILKGNANNDQCIIAGNGLADYMALIKYCEDHNCNLSNQADYDYVCSQIDADQFALYCAFEIIIGNTDTGNIKCWRSSELDNKWRWIQYDYCWAMNGDNPGTAAEKSTGYRRDFFWRYFDPAGHGAGQGFSTVLGRSMLSNNEFVKIFLKYCAYFFKEVYTTEKIVNKCNELQNNIRNEMETYDLQRWYPYNKLSTKGWNTHCSKIREYAQNYPNWYLYYCQHFINEHTNYHLSDEEMIELFGRVGKIS